jgi:hypothetical protein
VLREIIVQVEARVGKERANGAVVPPKSATGSAIPRRAWQGAK